MRYILNILKWPFGWLNSLTFGFFFFLSFSKRLCNWTLSFFSVPHFWQPFLTFNIFLPSGEAKNFEIKFWLLFVEYSFLNVSLLSHFTTGSKKKSDSIFNTLLGNSFTKLPSASIASCTFHIIAVDNFATFSAYYKARIPLPSVFNNLFFIFFWVFFDSTLKAQIYINSSKQRTAFSTMFLKILLAINCYPVPRLLPHLWVFVQQHSLSGTKMCISCVLLCNKLPQNLGA